MPLVTEFIGVNAIVLSSNAEQRERTESGKIRLMNTPQPTAFISHGAPTFALEPGQAGARLAALGKTLSDVQAILVVSPHWQTRGFSVMTSSLPHTMHDFGGFDPRLNLITYPAPGHPDLARLTAQLLESHGHSVTLDAQRGLDHGAWVPLLHLLPQADTPVFQLSMPHTLTAQGAFELGQMLQPLSDQGVLIIGSGSITHNLGDLDFATPAAIEAGDARVAPYAARFAAWVRDRVLCGDHESLIHTATRAPEALRAHPSDEHYLPLLVALGAAKPQSRVEALDAGFTYGAIGMTSFVWRV